MPRCCSVKSLIACALILAALIFMEVTFLPFEEEAPDQNQIGELSAEEQEIIDDDQNDFETKMDRLTMFRLSHLTEQCTDTGLVDGGTLFDFVEAKNSGIFENQPRLLVSDQHKVVFCVVDGAGSEFWKDAIARMELGDGKGENEIDHRFTNNPPNRLLWSYRDSSILYRVKNYHKFLFVRDPVRRILSAFLKYTSSRVGVKDPLLEKFFAGFDEDQSRTEKTKLESFIEHLIEQPVEIDHDAHWGSYAKLCSPCHLRYDFIGRFETMSDDVRHVLQKTKVKNIDYQSKEREEAEEEQIRKLRDTLSLETLQKLQKKFHVDFALFGYQQTRSEK